MDDLPGHLDDHPRGVAPVQLRDAHPVDAQWRVRVDHPVVGLPVAGGDPHVRTELGGLAGTGCRGIADPVDVELLQFQQPTVVVALTEPAARVVGPVGHGRVPEPGLTLDDRALPLEGDQLAEHDRREQHVEAQVEEQAATLPHPQALLAGDLPRTPVGGRVGRLVSADPPTSPAEHLGRPFVDHRRRVRRREGRAFVLGAEATHERRLSPADEAHPGPDPRDQAGGEADVEEQEQRQEERGAVDVEGAEDVQEAADRLPRTILAAAPRGDGGGDVGLLRHRGGHDAEQGQREQQVQRGTHPRQPPPSHQDGCPHEPERARRAPTPAPDGRVLLWREGGVAHAGKVPGGGGCPVRVAARRP